MRTCQSFYMSALHMNPVKDILVPVRVEGSLDNARGVNLLAIDRNNGERIRQTQKITLNERVGSNDCVGKQGRMDHRSMCRCGRWT